MAASREAFSSSSLVPEGGLWVGAMRVGFLAVRWRLPAPVGLPLARSAARGVTDSPRTCWQRACIWGSVLHRAAEQAAVPAYSQPCRCVGYIKAESAQQA